MLSSQISADYFVSRLNDLTEQTYSVRSALVYQANVKLVSGSNKNETLAVTHFSQLRNAASLPVAFKLFAEKSSWEMAG